ncbi:MAG TPA: hypothetical protein VGH19_21030 [Verrucomicrobiae bacterium]
MRSKISCLFSLSLLLLLCGCLEFEEQSMSYRYDEKTDTLYIFQDYRGIFGGSRKETLTSNKDSIAEEVEQLESVLKRERTFFFGNWITEFDREAFIEYSKELKSTPADENSKLNAEERKLLLALIESLLANVKVENGPFYYDAKKRLCGTQKVTLTKASEIIRNANRTMPMVLKSIAKEDSTTAAEKALILKAMEKRKDFIHLEKNIFSLVFPMSKPEFDKTFGPNAEPDLMVQEFKKCGGKIEFKDDEVHFSLGTPQDRITTLTLPVAKAKKDYQGYLPNAVDEVRKRAVILEKYDVEAARKEFLK